MSSPRNVVHMPSGRSLIPQAKWCDGFFSRMRGFTFHGPLAEGEGLVLVNKRDHRVDSSITMLFCFIDLGVVWVNDAGQVVDKVLAKPWRLTYAPQAAARYAIESHPAILDQVKIGDQITFE